MWLAAYRCSQVCRQCWQALKGDADRQQDEEGHDGDHLEQVDVIQSTLQTAAAAGASIDSSG
jgi:hypothetical protein